MSQRYSAVAPRMSLAALMQGPGGASTGAGEPSPVFQFASRPSLARRSIVASPQNSVPLDSLVPALPAGDDTGDDPLRRGSNKRRSTNGSTGASLSESGKGGDRSDEEEAQLNGLPATLRHGIRTSTLVPVRKESFVESYNAICRLGWKTDL